MERVTATLSDKTASGMQEVLGEVVRLAASQDTQRKYFVKEMLRVEGIAESAKEMAAGVQDQVSSVRQQTFDMHNSLTAMQRHSEQLTSGLRDIMVGFREMNFDMPTKFDNWLRVRLGNEGGLPSTISGEDLQKQSNNHPPLPAPPPSIAPLESATIPDQQSVDPNTESDQDGAKHSSSQSSTELYNVYLHSQTSQDNLMSQENSLLVDFGVNKDTAMQVDVLGESGSNRDSGAESVTREAGEVATGNSLPEDKEEGEILEERRPSVPTHMDELQPEPVGPIPSTIPSDATTGGPVVMDASADQEMAPMEPFSAASPISPNIVRSNSVEPPIGLLARNVDMSPPSSQPTMSSPSPLPRPQLLAVPLVGNTGPMTRSRSRSRSPSIPPPHV